MDMKEKPNLPFLTVKVRYAPEGGFSVEIEKTMGSERNNKSVMVNSP